ncbi:MAG: hypothetical protein LKE30_04180 [Bacteroidales bacterium]|jgi:hypothetical protein|nr:hypothetical protein [Bacteroidales bacterium]
MIENTNKIKRILFYVFLVLIVVDVCYSFSQHYNAELDGDMPESVLPLDYVKPIFNDPFGVNTIINQNHHAGPNRFFSHYLYNRYFNFMPFVLQGFLSPIQSVYASCAIAKMIMQLALIFFLTFFTLGSFRVKDRTKFAFIFLFFCSLFQTCGATRSIGIIDPAITYAFFYAMPLLFLVLYLLPFFFKEFYDKDIIKNKIILVVYSFVFLVLSCFSGATNPAIAFVFIFTIVLRYFIRFIKANKSFNLLFALKNIPQSYLYFLIPLAVLSLYSLYLGTYNSMYDEPISLIERYKLLPKGFLNMFLAGKGGFSFLFGFCLLNTIFIYRNHRNEGKHVVNLFEWIMIFSIVYILLLPFGGYRPYRPYIIRYDTIIAISFSLIFYLVYSSLFLIENIKTKRNIKWYYCLLGFIILLFTVADNPAYWRNDNEEKTMQEIASSKDRVVALKENCTIISWTNPQKKEDSENASRLMYFWKITKEKKTFYCEGN